MTHVKGQICVTKVCGNTVQSWGFERPVLKEGYHYMHVGLQCLAPLFEERQDAILPAPAPTPARAPSTRRKTMAGITISKNGGGFSITKPRAPGRPKAAPAARAAELLVCRTLGIVKDGEDVTAAALDAFATRFKDQLSSDVIVALRGLFKLDNDNATGVEEGLIVHGGEGALDLETNDDGTAAQQAVA